MNTEPLPRFDRELGLREQLAGIDGKRLLECLRALLGVEVHITDMHNCTVLGKDRVPTQCTRQVIQGDMEALGYLEAPTQEVARLQAATALIELLLESARRYHMASALHLEAVHADYEKLQCEHAALAESEARYKALAENLEQRVTQQVQTINTAQRHLYQSEKLASIGQLAAGVAHEINNPIGFITSNLNTARSYVHKLVAATSLIRNAQNTERAAAIFAQQDITLMLEDFKALLEESAEGAGRIMRIVADLKGFSNIDRTEEELTDINQKISQVCNVVRNTLQARASLSSTFQDIPLVWCHPGQLGQVLVNILLNASQAMTSFGHIHVQTELLAGEICIRISDDGCGIPQHLLPRIFEPFFTTKDVGQGTGLGLSVSHDIIQAHGGHIEVKSEVDTGSTFSIYLPLEKAVHP
ncbi:MAG: ATP-binding protein [Gammaproteobacteria bacterium]|nr:ATP-binding protein [Gammaproteobacteria bacterium]